MKRTLFILQLVFLFLIITNIQSFGQEIYRTPTISPGGEKISYSLQGDIWIVDINQKEPRRLTIHEGYESNPIFNEAGDAIGFNSDRYGNNDIFTIPVDGGNVNRKTWRSSDDLLTDWNNENLIFITERDYNAVEWDSEIYIVNERGGTPYRIADAFGEFATMSPDGKWLAFVEGSCRISREAYRGSANLDIWLVNRETGEFVQVTSFDGNDYMPRWQDNNTLWFISSESGRYNVNRLIVNTDGEISDREQITDERNFGVEHFDVSNSGDIVYSAGGRLVYRDFNGDSETLELKHTEDYRFDPVVAVSKSSDLTEFAVSPNGKYSALGIHGEIFVTENDPEKSKTRNISEHGYRDRYATWINDSTMVFTSDRGGNSDMYMARSTDLNKPMLLETLKHQVKKITDTDSDERNPVISPDGKRIAYLSGSKFILADIDETGSITNQQILHDEWWSLPEGVSWSPDSKWIAYSQVDLYFNSEIYIRSADGSGKPVNISMHPKADYMPHWSKDGKKLAFVSERNNQDYDIWFAWLNEDDWDKTQTDLEEGLYFDNSDEPVSENNDNGEEEEIVVEIDSVGIHNRLMQVTRASGNEMDPIFDSEGEYIYFTGTSLENDQTELYKVKWDGKDLEQVTNGGTSPEDLALSEDGKFLFYISHGKLAQFDLSSDKAEMVSFEAEMERDFEQEKQQMFDEAWNILNDGFYDPDFHGQNFRELRRKYEPLSLAASTITDFRYMFNLMLGQLNASHMGMYGDDRAETQENQTGLIGAEIQPAENGVEVLHVIPNSPADREQSKLVAGDIITQVNGKKVAETENFYKHFNNTAEDQMLLEIQRDGETSEVVIRPVNSLSDHLYDQWTDERRTLTEKYSNGRLGYIHIRGMNMPSFERFERELMASGYGKEGILIDVRYNGGGWTTDYLMAVLNVQQHAYTIPRGASGDLSKNKQEFRDYYPYSERLPLSAWTKPSIALANESSYSNAEIFSHAYKNLGIGSLVGVETFGAVISTGGARLIDGSLIRLPFRGWYVKNTDKNMDFGGAVPDYEVHNTPDYRTGEDLQLKKAVEILLEQLDEDNQ
ncbi:S41 family peptidase [Rhodohalobacter sulfatireducens]|uniref:Tricorn protease homolog n=1 Tax=Rhodohalobacter sulfatireducens TaxID=2911366 RepID=A0ABS9KBA5_9BACT|nr:S41 family peptidase [Rhodohalobacter sulfatireducens]MCG2588121.1 S41 family peptidase [Rhodohalobacter sulfatireducens]